MDVMKPLKVMTVVGTRPEIIRLSAVIKRLDEVVDHTLVHTGQNYDFSLNEVFFRDLGLREPDVFLRIATTSLGASLGQILQGTEQAIQDVRPDAFLVLGDTNSAISAVMARRMKVPVYHMEAGNRCFDSNVPEEVNRRLVDHVSDVNLVYTEHARRHLLAEGLPHRFIYLTGSPMGEVLANQAGAVARSDVLQRLELEPGQYLVVSAHREENVDDRSRLETLLETLEALARTFERPVVVSTHPRTRSRLDQAGFDVSSDQVRFLEPFGFNDFLRLQKDAFCVVSDSGTISEESSILGFPAVTIRDSMERPEALDSGSVMITGIDPSSVIRSVRLMTERPVSADAIPMEYRITDTSERVVRLIVGTAALVPTWRNLSAFNRYEWE